MVELVLEIVESVVLLSMFEFSTVELLSFELAFVSFPMTTMPETPAGKVNMEANRATRRKERTDDFFMTEDG